MTVILLFVSSVLYMVNSSAHSTLKFGRCSLLCVDCLVLYLLSDGGIFG